MAVLQHHALVLRGLLNQIKALLDKHPAVFRLLRVRRKLNSDSLGNCLQKHSQLAVDGLSIGLNEILNEIQVLVILDVLNALLDHFDHIWQQVSFLDSRKQILIASHSLERVN